MPWDDLAKFDKATHGAFQKYSMKARRAALEAANEYLAKHGDSPASVSSAIAIAHTVAKNAMGTK